MFSHYFEVEVVIWIWTLIDLVGCASKNVFDCSIWKYEMVTDGQIMLIQDNFIVQVIWFE